MGSEGDYAIGSVQVVGDLHALEDPHGPRTDQPLGTFHESRSFPELQISQFSPNLTDNSPCENVEDEESDQFDETEIGDEGHEESSVRKSGELDESERGQGIQRAERSTRQINLMNTKIGLSLT